MPDFSDMVIDPELGATTFNRWRPTVTLNDAGETVHAYGLPVECTGIVLPAQLADARLLPEGTNIDDVNAFFTSASVSCGDGVSTVADVLEHNGVKYKALRVQDFSQFGLYKVLAQRFAAGVQEPAPGGP